MSLRIKQITHDLAINFSKGEPHLIHKKKFTYVGLYVDDVLVSIMAYDINKQKAKLHSFYTPKEFRGRGYFSDLFRFMIDTLEKNGGFTKIIVDCLDDSKGIVEKNGFNLLREKQFKHFKVYYYTKEVAK